MRTLEYRTDFYFWGGLSVMWSVFNFFFFAVLAGVGNGIAGWSVAEMYVLLSVFTMLDALTWSFFYHNMKRYTQWVFSGELNQLLVRPINTQFLIMSHSNNYNNVFRFILGLGMLFWSLDQLSYQPTVLDVVGFIFFSFVAATAIYFLWFTLSTLSFWVEKLDNINEIIPALRRLWQIPRTVYTGFSAIIFTMIFPLGLITSLPSEILLGKSSWQWSGYLLGFTICIVLFSRWFFIHSIRKYSGVAN